MSLTRSYFGSVSPQRFLEGALVRWWRVSAIERNGVLYEFLGLRPLFSLIAWLFGESLPPAARHNARNGIEAPPTDRLRYILARTRYHEFVNLICIAFYTPALALTATTPHPGLLAYGVALVGTHLVALLLERYKRARCESLLHTLGEPVELPPEEALPEESSAVPSPWITSRIADLYFLPKPFETERFFSAIGLDRYRRFILWIARLSLPPAPEPSRRGRFLANDGAALTTFEAQTRIAETTHLIGASLHLPFLVLFLRDRFVPGLLYIAFLLYLNLYCVLLQRCHRTRLRRLMARRRPH